MKVLNVVGARPNFMKIAPIILEMKRRGGPVRPALVHTGQHYDEKMSKLFFRDLGLPAPDEYLGVGSGSHAEQTARIMVEFDRVLLDHRPDLVMVVGDVNSTFACAVTAVKRHIPVAHVEAGLRSHDWRMPEEINRMLSDRISSLLFVTEPSGRENLLGEGVDADRIFFVGNVMIDTLLAHREHAREVEILSKLGLTNREYAVLTLHRPENVDSPEVLRRVLAACRRIAALLPIVFPIHPRTSGKIREFGLSTDGLLLSEPLGYLDFLKLLMEARLVLTDSGGIQEETTVLGVPCLTLRENTERPVTVDVGTNVVVGTDESRIVTEAGRILGSEQARGSVPELWDGKTAARIVNVLENQTLPSRETR